MNIHILIITRIINEQELIIGPIAWVEAAKVRGMVVAGKKVNIQDERNGNFVVDNLIKQYSRLFGRASEEVCREAVKDLIAELPSNKIPDSLR